VIRVFNVLGIIVGVIVIVIGIFGLVSWWDLFVRGLKAIVPILLILIGAGALVYFISEVKSKLEIGKEKTSSTEEKKTEEK
jgi:multisubunit Na+/H+ antiporter MnhG subunit